MEGMKTVTLDAHTDRSQMAVISEHGDILIELRVEARPEELKRVVSGIPGPKRVFMESGPLSAMIRDALERVADEVVSCDPTKNPLISRYGRLERQAGRRAPGDARPGQRHARSIRPAGAVQDPEKPGALRLHARRGGEAPSMSGSLQEGTS